MAGSPLLLLTAFASIVTARQCYYPDGTESTDVPCSQAETTHCCAETSICMSNGYCLNGWPTAYGIGRGSCTDVDWNNPCPQQCIDAEYNNVHGGDNAVLLKVVDSTKYYCCGIIVSENDTVGCPNDQDPFVLGEASILLGYAALANVTSTSDSSTSTTTGATASNASNSTTDSACQDGDTSTKIGVGLGVPLGAIALLALAWALWERRKRNEATSMAGTGASVGAGANFNPGSSTGVVDYHAVQPQWLDYPGKPHTGVAQSTYSNHAQAELYNESPRAEMMAPGRDGQSY